MNSSKNDISSIQKTIWEKIQSGDQSALGEVFHEHYNELFYYGIKIIPDQEKVKDAIQDLFVTIAESSSNLGEVRNIKAYLLISLRRKILRNPKKQLSIKSDENEKETEFAFSPEEFMIHQESSGKLSNQLATCFEQLSSRQREVIMLRFYHELPMEEISTMLEMNIQSTRNLLFRALQKIRDIIPNDATADWGDVEVFLLTIFSRLRKL